MPAFTSPITATVVSLIVYGSLAILVLTVVRHRLKSRSIKHIQGPESPSWLVGNEKEIRHQEEVGDLEFQWYRQYGTVWRTAGPLGSNVLNVVDPRALQYIFHTSGYHFPKRIDASVVTELLVGPGMTAVEGEIHQRQRRVVSPAFGAGQLRSFLPLFQRSATKMSYKWKDLLQSAPSGEQTFNVIRQLSKTTIDVIGEAAFDYRFDAMDGKENVLLKSFDNLFLDSTLHPPTWDLIFKATWSYIPRPILNLVKYLPTREYKRFRSFVTVAKGIARDLFKDRVDSELINEKGKDIMSILISSNLSEDGNKRLDNDEVFAQMATFMLAGHDTTASSISWLLLELSRNPADQICMREEITAARARIGTVDFTIADLEELEWVNACIREVLRYHPIVPTLVRIAGRDDVIPLQYPITTTSGETISEIPISKGQSCTISIAAYNRLEGVWGDDAHKWNPGRFMGDKTKDVGLGTFSNLMTFSGGIRGCIGWRFAVIEMQALIVELIENFQFSLPAGGVDIQRIPAGFMIPLIRGKMEEGAQIPLKVSLVN